MRVVASWLVLALYSAAIRLGFEAVYDLFKAISNAALRVKALEALNDNPAIT